jgi:hypothetical protein
MAYSRAYDKFKQALDRVHRMNSVKPVNVYVVLSITIRPLAILLANSRSQALTLLAKSPDRYDPLEPIFVPPRVSPPRGEPFWKARSRARLLDRIRSADM